MSKKRTLKEAEEEYGSIQGYIDQLRELAELGDMQPSDVSYTLRDINFIRSEAGLKPIDEVKLMEYLV